MTQTIALAVDGMEPALLSRWIDSGELPNFEALRREGAYGTADCSSLSSAKQWTTHFTGVGTERHGVTGFLKSGEKRRAGDDAPDARELVNTTDIAVKTYPELLSERGFKVGLINPLPLWPPLELEGGFCISGMLTPSSADNWTYPKSLESELEEIGYRIDVRYGKRPYGFVDDALFEEVDMNRLAEDMIEVLERRIEYTKQALDGTDLDFLYCLLKSIDIIQHCFWAHMEADDERFGDMILDAYQRVDDLIGWVREETTANVLVFGDHGFQARSTRPPDAIHELSVTVGQHLPVPSFVRTIYDALFYREQDVDLGNPGQTTGIHANPAAWMAAGPDVNLIGKKDIAFEDITPTILALLDAPIPRDYVGTPPSKVCRGEATIEDVSLDIRRRTEIDESDVISERLHNLGYADMVDDAEP